MSYQANIDLVLAMNNLQISSFRKQGTIRFKLRVFAGHLSSEKGKTSTVTVPLPSPSITSLPATPITSIKHLNSTPLITSISTSPFMKDHDHRVCPLRQYINKKIKRMKNHSHIQITMTKVIFLVFLILNYYLKNMGLMSVATSENT